MTITSAQPVLMGERTLKDVLQAVQMCNTTLKILSNQFQHLRVEVAIIHHDVQKVWELTTDSRQ